MTKKTPPIAFVLITITLAAILWYINFAIKPVNFWLGMGLAVTILTGFALYGGGKPFNFSEWSARNVVIGICSAAVLYGLFWVGSFLSQLLFAFARPEVSAIYGIRAQESPLVIILLLFFITSPGEELFWRGFLQRWAMRRFGSSRGYLLTTAIYAAVHIPSGNFMLIMAALVAGLFWGFLYRRSGSIVPCIISHCAWTVAIFVLWPIT